MRNLKKFLALVLAMIMVMSASAMVSADFTDVANSDYEEAINDLTVKGIIKGMTETTFGPKQPVNREQMAIFMARVLTGDVENDWNDKAVTPFEDLGNYQAAIQYAWANGVINGKAPTVYAPADGIKYVEALAMAIRALGLDDGKIEWPWGYFNTAVNLGLTNGINGVSIEQALTREETAQIIYNLVWATPNGAESLASKNFSAQTADNTDLFVITSTPKQTHGNELIGGERLDYTNNNKGITYVGVQALVDGLATGTTYYIPAEEIGIAADAVEDYFFYAVELINFDAATGTFGNYVLGADPVTVTHNDVTVNNTGLSQTGGAIVIDDTTYFAINSAALTDLRNSIAIYDSFAMSEYRAKLIFDKDAATGLYYILDVDGNRVARIIGGDAYSGEFPVEALLDAALAMTVVEGVEDDPTTTEDETVEEVTELDIALAIKAALVNAWFYDLDAGKNISYEQVMAKYGVSYTYGIQWTDKLDKRLEDNAYQLKLYDDDRDGLYDRAVYVPVFMGVYDVVTTDKFDALVNNMLYGVDYITVYDAAGAVAGRTGVKASEVTYTDDAAKVEGTVSVYTYNPQLKKVEVLDILEPVTGTLDKYTVTNRGKTVTVTVDGQAYQMFYNKNDGVQYRWSDGRFTDELDEKEVKFAALGANIVIRNEAGRDPFAANFSIADNDKHAALDYYKAYANTGKADSLYTLADRISTGATVMYYVYNDYIIMIGELNRGILDDIAVVDTPREFYYEGLNMDIVTGGEFVENAFITVIDGKDISGYKTYDWLFASFLEKTTYHFPGSVFFTRYGVNKGESYEFDVFLDDEADFTFDYYGNGPLFQNVKDLVGSTSGTFTIGAKGTYTNGDDTLRTDADTVWYFIYTDDEDPMKTQVQIHTGAAYNANFEYDEDSWFFADKYNAAADLIIVKDVKSGVDFEKAGVIVGYLKGNLNYETGTAAEFGLVDKYGDYKGTYYRYADAKIFDLDSGEWVTMNLYSKNKYSAYDCLYYVNEDGMILGTAGDNFATDFIGADLDYAGYADVHFAASKATKFQTKIYNIQDVKRASVGIDYADVMAFINGDADQYIYYKGDGSFTQVGPVPETDPVESLSGVTSIWDLGVVDDTIIDAYFDKNGRLIATIECADGTTREITAEDDVTNLVVSGYDCGDATGADALKILNNAHQVFFIDFAENADHDHDSLADHTAVFWVGYYNLGGGYVPGAFEQ